MKIQKGTAGYISAKKRHLAMIIGMAVVVVIGLLVAGSHVSCNDDRMLCQWKNVFWHLGNVANIDSGYCFSGNLRNGHWT